MDSARGVAAIVIGVALETHTPQIWGGEDFTPQI